MDSMNLDNFANSLPASSLASVEADLQANFRAAAFSVAALYKSSRRASKRAYNTGYAAACQDLLLMIQQGVSAGDTSDADGRGVTIGRIMDYIEARLEAIRSREEEEEEDDEKERDRRPTASASTRPTSSTPVKPTTPPVSAVSRAREHVLPAHSAAPLTPLTPPSFTAAPLPPRPTSPTPTSHRSSAISPALQHASKARLLQLSAPRPKDSVMAPAATFLFPTAGVLSASSVADAPVTIIPPPPLPLPPVSSLAPQPLPELAGTKRRHATMVLDSTPAHAQTPVSAVPAAPGASTRRRTRTMRGAASGSSREVPLSPQDRNQGPPTDSMDVEEDGGRERKRVARR